MASSIFLDANGWLALLNSGDALHSQADNVWQQVVRSGSRVIVTDWIVAEVGNCMSRLRTKDRLQTALQRICATPSGELVFVDDALLHRSLEYFEQHGDKTWGLVDCASFLVMQDRGITDAFTSDRHFEQAGFRCLLELG